MMRKQIFAVLFLVLAMVSSIAANEKCKISQTNDDASVIFVSCVEATLDDIRDLDERAERMQFDVSKLICIPKRAFASFPLRRLSFYNCDIRYIDPDAFQGLDHLKWLVFYGSNINILEASWFKGLRSLTHLSLKKNNIAFIEPKLFLQIPNLKELDIEDNDLDCLTEYALAPLRGLRSVRIGKNPWLCGCYKELRNWLVHRHINFEEEKLSEHECMAEYDELKPYTRKWVMSNNERLQEAQALYEKPTPSLSNPSDAFTTILQRIPNDVESIRLSGMAIQRLPNFAFFQFGNSLRSLNITDCHITDISPGAFAGLPKLEQLILVNDNISIVKHQWFQDFRVLKHLALDRNRIRSIEPNTFVTLNRLETLSLNYNRIECLSIDTFSFLRNLKRIDIINNLWNCGCQEDVENFKFWLTGRQIGHAISWGFCTGGKADASEHEYGLKYGKNSTGQMFESKLVEMNHQNFEGETNRTETQHERHETITSSGYNISITQQQQHSQRLTRNETIKQNAQNIMQQQQQQQQQQLKQRNYRQSENYRTSAQVDFTTIQGNFHNTGQIQQPLPIPGDCIKSSINTESWICSGVTLQALSKIPGEARSIRFEDSTVSVIPNFAFARFRANLQVLEFLNCRIQIIESQAFSGLVNLRELILKDNNISEVQSSWFESTYNLNRLSLPHNSIKTIKSTVFQHLSNLEEFDISDNDLNCISPKAFLYMQKLRRIKIGYNPWSCLCLTEMIARMDRHGVDYDKNISTQQSIGNCGNVPPITTSLPVPSTQPSGLFYSHCKMNRNTEHYRNCRCVGIDPLVLDEIPNVVESIEIFNSTIPFLPAYKFSRFTNLKKLLFYNCSIQDIDPLAFYGLHKLESLILSNNNIPIVKSVWFNDTINLTELRLDKNSITKIENQVFQNLPNLRTLSLQGNMISYIDTRFMNSLNKLKEVSLKNNALEPNALIELREFFERRNVSYTLYDPPSNAIVLCDNVSDCKTEGPVTVATSPLPQPPQGPPGNCTFEGNTGKYIDSTCVDGDLLVLKNIPDTVERIEIFNSTIPTLPAHTFARFTNLKKLLFYNCSIRNIDASAFHGLHKLESLTFINNNIPIIKSAWFDELTALTELRLVRNSITDIEDDVFQKLPNLKILSLQDNLIRCIYTYTLQSLNRLENVSLENNPLKWRCFNELSQFLENRNVSYTKFDTYQGKLISYNYPNTNPEDGRIKNCNVVNNTSISTVNVICISIAMLIFTKI